MSRFPISVIAIVAMTFAATASSNTTDSASFDQGASRLDALFRAASASDGSYLVRYRRDGQVISRGYGGLDCAGKAPMPSNALFDGGSLTKLFTTAAVYKLIEEGRLKLDDRVGEVFPAVPADKRNITIAQLLSHRSGIPNLIGPDGALPQSDWSIDSYDYAPLGKAELLGRVWNTPLQFAPGSEESYSNTGFTMLAAVIEQASGQPYEAYVRDRILLPLEMTSTGYLLLDRGGRPITQQCRNDQPWNDPITRGVWKDGVSWNLVGAGGMMTTLDDLDKWSTALEDGKVLRSDLQERFEATYFGPSYRCRTRFAAVGGSNGMTRSLILHMPQRRELLVTVGTRAENRLPAEVEMLEILCPS